jgi:hypothetical protein
MKSSQQMMSLMMHYTMFIRRSANSCMFDDQLLSEDIELKGGQGNAMYAIIF